MTRKHGKEIRRKKVDRIRKQGGSRQNSRETQFLILLLNYWELHFNKDWKKAIELSSEGRGEFWKGIFLPCLYK